MPRHRTGRALGGLLLFWTLAATACGTADRPVVTAVSPADRAVLPTAPAAVEVATRGRADLSLSHVTVLDAAGTARNAGSAVRAGDHALRQPVTLSSAGDFTIAYHVVLADGSTDSGVTRFSIGTATAGAAAPVAAEHPHGHEIDPLSAWLLVANGVTVAAALLVLLLVPPRRRTAGDPAAGPQRRNRWPANP